MKLPKAILIGAAVLSLAAGPARAADIAPGTIQTTPAMAAPGFSWAGPYIGIAGRSVVCITICVVSNTYELGLRAGTNIVRGRFLGGVSGELGVYYDTVLGAYFYAEANARAGVLLGERAVLYAQAGAGFLEGPYLTAGGGLEFALNERISIYGEFMPQWYMPGFFGPDLRYGLGVNFHLQR